MNHIYGMMKFYVTLIKWFCNSIVDLSDFKCKIARFATLMHKSLIEFCETRTTRDC